MLLLQDVSYHHPNKESLFSHLHLSIKAGEKLALIGNNGAGKSTLLKLMAGMLQPTSGQITNDDHIYYLPQLAGSSDGKTAAQLMQVDQKLYALKAIMAGETGQEWFEQLDDDWLIEDRITAALEAWGLPHIDPAQSINGLSGGEKTKLMLAGLNVHQPRLVLMDEPTNHLDRPTREQLYNWVGDYRHSLIVVSHDRQLLESLPLTYELSHKGLIRYGGNYSFYQEQRALEDRAFQHDLEAKEKALKKAREVARETRERQEKLDARGKGKQDKAGVARIMMNTYRNSAENSTAKSQAAHDGKLEGLKEELNNLREAAPDLSEIKLDFSSTSLHQGKLLIKAEGINYRLSDRTLWPAPIDLEVFSGEKIHIEGPNGSGKTTLIRLLTGDLQPGVGSIQRADFSSVYLDQDYSMIRPERTVFQQAEAFNQAGLLQHELGIRLTRFLFPKAAWDKQCQSLSGGERMRLSLCCLTLSKTAPDMIILDEPTNNLDLQNIAILTQAMKDYNGTVLIVSHDAVFLQQINPVKIIRLEKNTRG